MNYLLFRLYGPLASWGEVAIGESRHTGLKPKKSAMLGLLGAALGIQREDDVSQAALAEGYKFAFNVRSTGQLLRDYHTTQVPDSVGKFSYRTRRDELVLGKERLGTILSTREYRTDTQVVVAVRAEPDAVWPLAVIKEALLKPIYHLYIGRKSCPLAIPLNPELLSADDFYGALQAHSPKALLKRDGDWDGDARWLPDDQLQAFYWEGEIADFSEVNSHFDPSQVQQLQQYDQPVSRRRWQFESRMEYYWQAIAKEAS